jgi:hypothetical protein
MWAPECSARFGASHPRFLRHVRKPDPKKLEILHRSQSPFTIIRCHQASGLTLSAIPLTMNKGISPAARRSFWFDRKPFGELRRWLRSGCRKID